ncbi:MAG: hypothetical protein WD381_01880 [Balneolaceae bacterium]
MKSKNKLGHSPLESRQEITSQYDFIANQNFFEKKGIIRKNDNLSFKREPFNINEEFKREKELKIIKLNTKKPKYIQDIPLKVLNALKDFLKL